MLAPLAVSVLIGITYAGGGSFQSDNAFGSTANSLIALRGSIHFTNATLYFGGIGIALILIAIGWAILDALRGIDKRLAQLDATLRRAPGPASAAPRPGTEPDGSTLPHQIAPIPHALSRRHGESTAAWMKRIEDDDERRFAKGHR